MMASYVACLVASYKKYPCEFRVPTSLPCRRLCYPQCSNAQANLGAVDWIVEMMSVLFDFPVPALCAKRERLVPSHQSIAICRSNASHPINNGPNCRAWNPHAQGPQ